MTTKIKTMLLSALAAAALLGAQAEAESLVVYFSYPAQGNLSATDANTAASVLIVDGEVVGSVQYMARVLAEKTSSDLYRIETVQEYPHDYEELLDYAQNELKSGTMPELKGEPLDLSLYDEIYLGYPIWWYDLPMAVYSFLDKYDLSGKTIYPFCSHGGSRFLRTINDIAKLEPGAKVEREGLAMRRNDVLDDASEDIDDWLESLK